LKAKKKKIVFAESCTGGLASGALTRVPGISSYHCGGVVVYRNETKQAYLKIPATVLADAGPVSELVAELMATSVLGITPEADLAASVTGHLGPNAPPDQDGLVFMAVVSRAGPGEAPARTIRRIECKRRQSRATRQDWVVEQLLKFVGDELEGEEGD
jgi:nicotinamide-nucleotide amidase